MPLGKVLARGRITVPRTIRNAAGLKPGDVVSFQVTGPGTVELTILPRLRLTEALERYRIEGPIDEVEARVQWQAQAATELLGTGDA